MMVVNCHLISERRYTPLLQEYLSFWIFAHLQSDDVVNLFSKVGHIFCTFLAIGKLGPGREGMAEPVLSRGFCGLRSAVFEMGNTKVIAVVYGPHEVVLQKQWTSLSILLQAL